MIIQKSLPGEGWLLYSPIGVRLLDDITGNIPFGSVRALLDRRTTAGSWLETKVKAVMTPSGYLSYPGLERHPDVSGPGRRYRIRIETDFYGLLYRAIWDGIEFDAFPYNDSNPPSTLPPPLPQDVMLTPASNYPFQPHIPVLRGRVVDAQNEPVADSIVYQGLQERVVTDTRGVFALPLRWVQPNVQVFIDATHPRTGRVGSIQIIIPNDLGRSHHIQI